MRFRHLHRAGRYYRVCDPKWEDCCDTSFSRERGGRWNAPKEFGVLYLCKGLAVAAANARQNFVGEAHSLYDLKPEYRPVVLEFMLAGNRFVDAVTDEGLAAIGLPTTYPFGRRASALTAACRAIGRAAYAESERGIACRSAAEATPRLWVGEELVLFDRSVAAAKRGQRRDFGDWYPTAALK